MAGTPANARQWADADVYVAFLADTPTPTVPADVETAFNGDWDLVGLLDGDAGFNEARTEDETDLFAWGGILVRTARRNFKMTRSFTAIEHPMANETVFRLAYPGSTFGSKIVVPSGSQIERVKVAFEKRDGDHIRRLITAYEAEVKVDGDIAENETALSSIPFVVTVFPASNGDLFTLQETSDES